MYNCSKHNEECEHATISGACNIKVCKHEINFPTEDKLKISIGRGCGKTLCIICNHPTGNPDNLICDVCRGRLIKLLYEEL